MSEYLDIDELVNKLHNKTPPAELLDCLETLHALSLEDDTYSLLKQQHYNCVDKLLRLLQVEDDEVVEKAAAVIANLGGSISRGCVVKKWEYGSWTLPIKELPFAEGELGWQTWESGRILSELLLQREIVVFGEEVLELGCGTGLASILCCKMGAKRVTMTDYQPRVLNNAHYNCQQNGCDDIVDPVLLDWNMGATARETIGRQFGTIIAGDVVYDAEHGEMLSVLIGSLLMMEGEEKEEEKKKGGCHVVLPGPAYRSGIPEFESAMEKRFHMEKRKVYKKPDGVVAHTYYFFRWRKNVEEMKQREERMIAL